MSEITSKKICYNYKIFSNVFVSEDFLEILLPNLAYTLVHFRPLNNRLPIQRGRIQNIPFEERICTKCNSEDIGDEFHYIFQCSFFAESRQKFLPGFYYRNANATKFNSFLCSKKKRLLINLANFVKIIMKEF